MTVAVPDGRGSHATSSAAGLAHHTTITAAAAAGILTNSELAQAGTVECVALTITLDRPLGTAGRPNTPVPLHTGRMGPDTPHVVRVRLVCYALGLEPESTPTTLDLLLASIRSGRYNLIVVNFYANHSNLVKVP